MSQYIGANIGLAQEGPAKPPLISTPSFANVTPISFDRSSFSGLSFSSEDFLADRRHIELDRLKSELQQGLRDLKTELVELINLDYADFINLSTKLVGVDTMIVDLAKPLETINSVVQSVRDSLADVIFQLEDELQKRALIREKKLYIQLFISIHESIEKLDALLHVSKEARFAKNQDLSNGDETVTGGKLIERVANEYSQLRYLISKANGTPFVQKIEKRISRIKTTLSSSLSKSLTAAYKDVMANSGDLAARAALSQILRTYVSVDRVDEAVSIFQKSITGPFLEQVITRQSLALDATAPAVKLENAGHPLRNMYKIILNFLRNDCAPVIDITLKSFRGTGGILFVDGIWVAIANAIVKTIPFIFNPGIPEVFHENYIHTIQFMSNMEALCRTKKSLDTFRTHSVTVDFLKRWQLPVYFQIRFREIATDFEETTITTYDLGANLTENEGLLLPPSSALIICINLCWDEKIFLQGLSHRFWKLTLQLLARYAAWVQEALNLDVSTPAISNEPENHLSPPLPNRPPSASQPERPLPPVPDSGDEGTLRKFLHFYHDLRNIRTQVMSIFDKEIRSKLPEAVRNEELLRVCLDESLSQLHRLIPDLTKRVCSVLIKRCSDPLRDNVRSIKHQYQMTNKEAPTKASYFIPTAFAPLLKFFETNQNIANSPSVMEWTTIVVENVTARYTAEVSAELARLKSHEAMRTRMKKPKRTNAALTGAGDEETLSDYDKVRLQLYLDAEQFSRQVGALSVDPQTVSSFQELQTVVKPFAELLQKQ
ncbi:oligomeric golgi complex component, COG2-domain-containing protein [Powellomyces hirtus]|nr:oligomeric golgi complex component, COG2-domain-containing protein [Powellomyces hirtus]